MKVKCIKSFDLYDENNEHLELTFSKDSRWIVTNYLNNVSKIVSIDYRKSALIKSSDIEDFFEEVEE